MKIYTRTGDDGTTGLFGGTRVRKDDARVEAYGTVDETSAAIGVARAIGAHATMDALLGQLQDDLFTLGAELACVPGKEENLRMRLLDEADGQRLEAAIDEAEDGLPPLTSFVLSGGTPTAAALHLARTVARRAERRTLEAARHTPVRPAVIIYLNRLSDLLFTLARRANHLNGVNDVPWKPRTGPADAPPGRTGRAPGSGGPAPQPRGASSDHREQGPGERRGQEHHHGHLQNHLRQGKQKQHDDQAAKQHQPPLRGPLDPDLDPGRPEQLA